jgi:hypothetical protein
MIKPIFSCKDEAITSLDAVNNDEDFFVLVSHTCLYTYGNRQKNKFWVVHAIADIASWISVLKTNTCIKIRQKAKTPRISQRGRRPQPN